MPRNISIDQKKVICEYMLEGIGKKLNSEIDELDHRLAVKPKEYIENWRRFGDKFALDNIELGIKSKRILQQDIADTKKKYKFVRSTLNSFCENIDYPKTYINLSYFDVMENKAIDYRKQYEAARSTISS